MTTAEDFYAYGAPGVSGLRVVLADLLPWRETWVTPDTGAPSASQSCHPSPGDPRPQSYSIPSVQLYCKVALVRHGVLEGEP